MTKHCEGSVVLKLQTKIFTQSSNLEITFDDDAAEDFRFKSVRAGIYLN